MTKEIEEKYHFKFNEEMLTRFYYEDPEEKEYYKKTGTIYTGSTTVVGYDEVYVFNHEGYGYYSMFFYRENEKDFIANVEMSEENCSCYMKDLLKNKKNGPYKTTGCYDCKRFIC